MAGDRRLLIASVDDILSGRATDVYFQRAREVLEREGYGRVRVRAELHVYGLPPGYDWAILAGVEEALSLFEGKPVSVYAMREGTLFRDRYPLMLIEGPYTGFAVIETALLGLLRHYTSIATKAARVKKAAGNRQVLFFGLRSLHPALQPMADRAALVGGVDGVSGVLSGEYLGVQPRGTMPHSFIITVGRQEEAWILFDKHMPPEVPRIALVDTFYDEREEALMAARALGERLHGVRLDTPSSRRGNLRRIVEEVRWALDVNGYSHVRIYVSGGLDEETIRQLRDIVDGFGVGTSIAFPPSIDISMDIVEVDRGHGWRPLSKRGKLPGARQVYRCPGLRDTIVRWGQPPPDCGEGGEPQPLLEKAVEEGQVLWAPESLDLIRRRVRKQLEILPE